MSILLPKRIFTAFVFLVFAFECVVLNTAHGLEAGQSSDASHSRFDQSGKMVHVREGLIRDGKVNHLKREQEIKMFILVAYAYLSDEILTGKGHYVDSLLSLLKIKKADKQRHLALLKTMLVEQEGIVNFANAVINRYLYQVTAYR